MESRCRCFAQIASGKASRRLYAGRADQLKKELDGDLDRRRCLLGVSKVWGDPRLCGCCGGPDQIHCHFLGAGIQAKRSCLGTRHMVALSPVVMYRHDREAVEGSLGKAVEQRQGRMQISVSIGIWSTS